MNSIDALRQARGRYGSSQTTETKTGDANRSFPLTEDELQGLGHGPLSIRCDGEHKDGKYYVHRVIKIEGDAPEDEESRAEGPDVFSDR